MRICPSRLLFSCFILFFFSSVLRSASINHKLRRRVDRFFLVDLFFYLFLKVFFVSTCAWCGLSFFLCCAYITIDCVVCPIDNKNAHGNCRCAKILTPARYTQNKRVKEGHRRQSAGSFFFCCWNFDFLKGDIIDCHFLFCLIFNKVEIIQKPCVLSKKFILQILFWKESFTEFRWKNKFISKLLVFLKKF